MKLGLKGNLHSVVLSNSKQRVVFTTFKMASTSLKRVSETYSGVETLTIPGGFSPIVDYIKDGSTEHLPISPVSSIKEALDPKSSKKIYFFIRRPEGAMASAIGTVLNLEGDRLFRRLENKALRKELLKYQMTPKYGFLESLPHELLVDYLREALYVAPELFYSDTHVTNFYFGKLLGTLSAISAHSPDLLNKTKILDLDQYNKSAETLRIMSTDKLVYDPLSKENVNSLGEVSSIIEKAIKSEPVLNLDLFRVLHFYNNLCYEDIKNIYSDILLK